MKRDLDNLFGKRGTFFWAAIITAAVIAVVVAGSQIAHDRGQSVEWYTGFGQWLGALGSFAAAAAALWISVSDRQRSDEERRQGNAQVEADLGRQAALVRVTAEMLGRRQAVGPAIRTAALGIRNRRTDRIFDIEVLEFVHQGEKKDLPVARVNGFAVYPRREEHASRFPFSEELPGMTLDTDEWLVIYQPDQMPNVPADYAAVAYTDAAGRRWQVDTEGSVKRL
ncbi:MAG: hypothetical protein VX424_14060 [Actinomycetota bacterium]|nr:hypothetical protein [Actinomycetota bacterium]